MINFKGVKSANLAEETQLLILFDNYINESYRLDIPFSTYAEKLIISLTTVKRYIKNFRDCGLLKFRFKHSRAPDVVMLNPKYFQSQTGYSSADLEMLQFGYDNFEGD